VSCVWLGIPGAILEIVGFFFVAWEITQAQRREFGTPTPFERTMNRIRRWIGQPRHHIVELTPAESMEVAVALTYEKSYAPAALLEDRVARLEKYADELARRNREVRSEIDKKVQELSDRISRELSTVRSEAAEREEQRREELRISLRVQRVATLLFILGVALTAAGSTVQC
jgi:hypothetical protein